MKPRGRRPSTFRWTAERPRSVNSYLIYGIVFWRCCWSSVERWNLIRWPSGSRRKALPNKTRDKFNFYHSLLAESHEHRYQWDPIPMLWSAPVPKREKHFRQTPNESGILTMCLQCSQHKPIKFLALWEQRIVQTLWLRRESFLRARLTPRISCSRFFLAFYSNKSTSFRESDKPEFTVSDTIHCHLIRFCRFWEYFTRQMHICIVKPSESNSTLKVSLVLSLIKLARLT